MVKSPSRSVPRFPIPPGVTQPSPVKLRVEIALRGPPTAGLIKFVEELLNPDVNTMLAAVERVILHPVETLLPAIKSAQLQSTTTRLHADETGSAVRNPRKGKLSTIIG